MRTLALAVAVVLCTPPLTAWTRSARAQEPVPPESTTAPAAPATPDAPPAGPVETPPAPAPEQPEPEPAPPPPAPPAKAEPAPPPPPPLPMPAAPPPPEAPQNEKPDPGIEVTVTGTSTAKTAGSSHVLKAKQLERFEYDDPHAVLAQVPGVYSRGEDGVGLRPNIGLRGVNPDRSKKITLMEDGVLFGPAPYSAPAAYYFPLITRMSQVKVTKGPGSIGYGPQTVGGALDLITRRVPSFFSGGVDLAAGQYGYGKAHAYAGNSDGKTGYVIEGIHLRDDGFKYLPNGTDIGFHRNEWMWKGFYKFEPIHGHASELQLKLTYADEVSNETYLGLSDADFRRDPYMRYDATQLDRMQWFRTSVVATYRLELTDKATLTVDAYRHDFTRTWRKVNGFKNASLFDVLTSQDDPRNQVYHGLLTGELSSSTPQDILMVGPNQREFVSQGVQAVVRWTPQTGSVTHAVEAGARLHYDRIRRRHSEDGYQLQNGQLVPAGLPTTVTAYNEGSALANALHLTDSITWKGLNVTPGVRVELIHTQYSDYLPNAQGGFDDNSHFQSAVLPGVGVFQALTKSFGLLAGVHRGFSPAVPEGGTPEKSINYEAGGRLTKGGAQAEVIGYYNDYQNLTDFCTQESGCLATNVDRQLDIGKARIYGLEVFGRHEKRFGTFTVPVTLAYTITKAQFLTSFVASDPIYGNVKKGDELPYVPRHVLNGALGLEHLRGGINVSATYVSGMREQSGSLPLSQVLSTDRQFVMDASAQARLYGPFVLYVNVRNIFNEAYIVSRRPFGARPNIPRWVQLGVRATF